MKPGKEGIEYIEMLGELAGQDLETFVVHELARTGYGGDYSLPQIMEAAADLPAKFGLGPSLPVFCVHAAFVRGRPGWSKEADRFLVKRLTGVSATARGWTPNRAPDRPRLMLTEKCGVDAAHPTGYGLRHSVEIFQDLVHETGHRLGKEFPQFVDWDERAERFGEMCCEGVRQFGSVVSERSAPGWISLGEYEELAAKCRRGW